MHRHGGSPPRVNGLRGELASRQESTISQTLIADQRGVTCRACRLPRIESADFYGITVDATASFDLDFSDTGVPVPTATAVTISRSKARFNAAGAITMSGLRGEEAGMMRTLNILRLIVDSGSAADARGAWPIDC